MIEKCYECERWELVVSNSENVYCSFVWEVDSNFFGCLKIMNCIIVLLYF